MNSKIEPAVFLGRLLNRKNPLGSDYFTALKSFFQKFQNESFIWIEFSNSLNSGEYTLVFGSREDEVNLKGTLEEIMNKYSSKGEISTKSSAYFDDYIKFIDMSPNKVTRIMINELNHQTLIDIGKELSNFRKQGYLLIGLGNMTQKDVLSDLEPTEEVKEFDSWIRIKLWEFDYYSIRDIETFFPIKRELYLEQRGLYGPFLVVFGSLNGADVINDLFSGFEGNNSLRSFYFTPNVNY